MSCYVDPKELSMEIIEKTKKSEGDKVLKEKFSMNNLFDVVRTNLAFLRIVDANKQRDQILQKLRNICLCIEMAQNKEVVGEAHTSST
jgi:hypothetical protein